MAHHVDVTTVILSYNTEALLRDCIASLREQTKRTTYEIIVVDNNSSDDSVAMVHAEFPEARVIVNRENLGFAKANNIALAQSRGRYVLLLNSDTLVLPSAIDVMKDFLDSHPGAGIVGSKTLYPDGSVQATARRFPSPVNALFGRKSLLTRLFPSNRFSTGYLTCLHHDQTDPFEVDWVAGSCLMIRRSVLEEVGLLDEGYWMYWEDADWCYRASNHGWRTYCVPAARIIHYEGASSTTRPTALVVAFHRSAFRFYRKHCVGSRLSPALLIALVGLSLRAGALVAHSHLKRLIGGIRDHSGQQRSG